ncbi:MAG: histidine kinase N-terminal domain-containing protein [Fusicatenibacter sp.]|nr:histidine kinase N-terminal domain-containing protein [Fusicatenibacter sp.]
MSDVIKQLCEEYTDLSEEEIQVIQMMAGTLQPLANLEAADMFVDCPCLEGDAIVVAEAKPEEVPSSYKNSVVGMLAKAVNEPAVARTFKLGIATKYMKARTQEDNYTIQSVEPIKYNSRVIGVLIRERRITEESEEEGEREHCNAVETPLNHMINENEWLTESIDEGLLLVDIHGVVTFRNMYARELFQDLGYVEDILGQKYKNICLNRYDEESELSEVLTEVQVGKHYLRIRQIQMDKGDIQLAVIIRDITWNREQEKSLVLKSAAIRELHHRVKNNLQTMASLLRLQARRTDSEETKRVLYESINRILSMSVTHQLLSQTGVEDVNLKEVLRVVKNNAVQPFLRPNLKVDLELLGDDITVNSDIATSAALAVNELLVNSMKYAFEGREEGKIQIRLEKGKVYSTVTVTDDGIGFDASKKKKESLGLNLVQTMVQDKLHGNLKIRSSSRGTKVTFDFINETADLVSISE